MKILLVAPQPFYQERGTPIAVDLLCKALDARGCDVDLLVFHEGEDKQYRNVQLFRARPILKVEDIKPGFSVKKILCDISLFFKMIGLVRRNRYDVIHVVEEASFMAWLIWLFKRTPYIVDIDSSMTTQLVDKFGWLRPLQGALAYFESIPVKRARLVIPVCQALADDVARYRNDGVFLLKDVSLVNNDGETSSSENLRKLLNVDGDLFVYIGNLESYQGIDLLIDSFALALKERGDLFLAIIGGSDQDIDKYKAKVDELAINRNVFLVGRRPVSDIGQYMRQADVLVSPRIKGQNTPMKVYSYLDSGVAVLATDLPTHTQVMTNEIGELAEADNESFSKAIVSIAGDPEKRKLLSIKAREYIKKEHSIEAFNARVNYIYDQL